MKVRNTQKLIIERVPACVIQHDETGVLVGDRLMLVSHGAHSNRNVTALSRQLLFCSEIKVFLRSSIECFL